MWPFSQMFQILSGNEMHLDFDSFIRVPFFSLLSDVSKNTVVVLSGASQLAIAASVIFLLYGRPFIKASLVHLLNVILTLTKPSWHLKATCLAGFQ